MKKKHAKTIWTICGVLMMITLTFALTIRDTGITGDPTIDTVTTTTIIPDTGGLTIDQNNNEWALNIDSEATTPNTVIISSQSTGDALKIDVDQNGQSLMIDSEATTATPIEIKLQNTDGRGMLLQNDAQHTASTELVKFYQNHASSTTKVLNVANDGAGKAIFVDQNGQNNAVDIDSEATQYAALQVSGEPNDGYTYFDVFDGGVGKLRLYRNDAVEDDVVLRLGTMYLWVDSTGDLRIHNAFPTGDLNGTVVGAQS